MGSVFIGSSAGVSIGACTFGRSAGGLTGVTPAVCEAQPAATSNQAIIIMFLIISSPQIQLIKTPASIPGGGSV
jgi:hypothetical protein